MEPAFKLKWKDGAYYVSEPNIGDTEVFTRAQVEAALAAEKAEALKDAARYRWLKDAKGDVGVRLLDVNPASDLDHAIDCAIASAEGQVK